MIAKRLLLVFSIAFIPFSAMSAPELKGSPQELRGFLYPADKVVTLSASAEEKAYSDKAIVSLVITTEDKLLSQSIAKNASVRSQARKALIKEGIPSAAIKSSKFSSSPEYGWFGKKPSSYKVVNRIAVSIVDEQHLQDIAVIADQNPEIELSNTAFEHTQKDQFNAKVKAKALDKILKQKQFYEQSLGVTLTTIGIRDSKISQRATRGAMALEGVVMTARSRAEPQSAVSSGKRYMADTASEPSFDEVKYQANLAVIFKIEQ